MINKFKKSRTLQRLSEVFQKDGLSSQEVGRTSTKIFVNRYLLVLSVKGIQEKAFTNTRFKQTVHDFFLVTQFETTHL